MNDILLANRKMKGKATAQIAHLVFANTQENPKKTKRAISCQHSDKNKYLYELNQGN